MIKFFKLYCPKWSKDWCSH